MVQDLRLAHRPTPQHVGVGRTEIDGEDPLGLGAQLENRLLPGGEQSAGLRFDHSVGLRILLIVGLAQVI